MCRHHHRLKHTPSWTHTLTEDGRTVWVSPAGVAAETFPALWVHTDEEVLPPPEGTSEAGIVGDLDEEDEQFYQGLRQESLAAIGAPQEYPAEPPF